MEKKRYYNDNIGPIKENEVQALKKALELSKEIGDITQITLLIHTKGNTGYLKRVFETQNLQDFFRGVIIDKNYPPLKIETIRTFNDDWHSKKVVVAYGLRSNELHKFDDYERERSQNQGDGLSLEKSAHSASYPMLAYERIYFYCTLTFSF